MRAFVKLRNRSDNLIPGICADIDEAIAKGRGTNEAGGDPKLTYYAVTYLACDSLRKWKHKKTDMRKDWVMWMYAPRGLGGLGYPNFLQFTTNMGAEPIDEGLANMERVFCYLPET